MLIITSNDTHVEGNNLMWTEVNKTELESDIIDKMAAFYLFYI